MLFKLVVVILIMNTKSLLYGKAMLPSCFKIRKLLKPNIHTDTHLFTYLFISIILNISHVTKSLMSI
jgi:hypothetical protein